MKIAIPTREGMVDNHFGHCAYYTLLNFPTLFITNLRIKEFSIMMNL